MTAQLHPAPSASDVGWYSTDSCSVANLRAVVETTTNLSDYPWADEVVANVLVYSSRVLPGLADLATRRTIQTELGRALLTGPGIVVFKHAFDTEIVDRVTTAFEELIAAQKISGATAGDHFARPGANDRVWGALDKLALHDPDAFADYYANDLLALVSTAWLGPCTKSPPKSTW